VAELALDDVDGNARGPRVRLRGHGGVDRERTAAESLLRRPRVGPSMTQNNGPTGSETR
jgi:hypothetical protein